MNKTKAYGILSFAAGCTIILVGFTVDSTFNGGKASAIGGATIVIGSSLLSIGVVLSMWGTILERNTQ